MSKVAASAALGYWCGARAGELDGALPELRGCGAGMRTPFVMAEAISGQVSGKRGKLSTDHTRLTA